MADNDHIDVEIEDENHSVSDLMTTDEDEPDDEQDDDDEDDHEGGDDDDKDDEPILGSWMESMLSPPETEADLESKLALADAKGCLDEKKAADDEVKALIGEFIREKESATAFMEMALTILSFLSRDVVGNRSDLIRHLAQSGFNSNQISTLIALILKDLDAEKSATEIGGISNLFDDSLNRVYVDFCQEISKLVQNVLTLNFFSTPVLDSFLGGLGIDLNEGGRWPFGLTSRSLAVLIQVLLLKPDREGSIVAILKRVLDTLVQDISNTASGGYSDLPVEHAQTIIFLFHTLR